jgi:hypothetical protein
VIILEMADHGFDGGSASHLAADGLCYTPDLAGDPDLEPVRIVVTAIALVAVDAADLDTRELFEIGDDGTEGMAVGLPCNALACSTNCPPLGAVTGVAIETLQPNS